MESAKDIAWARFWEERGRSYPEDDPVAIDGWDYGISRMGVEEAGLLREQISRELLLGPQSKLLEVGCGAGMFLAPICRSVERAVGCDLSESMLQRARRIDDGVTVQAAEAGYLPYASNSFDAILVYSVFHYFPSNEYANRVLRELARVCCPSGRIWLGDIPDKTRQREALAHRDRLMEQSQPKWKWPNVGSLKHRFYDQRFFIVFCETSGCSYRFLPQSVAGYVQGQYRYNVCLEKR